MKTVTILRAPSNSGKSSFAEYLKYISNGNVVICCADDYFVYQDGSYHFNPSLLGEAHNQCKEKFLRALDNNSTNIIVANTNSKESEFSYYIEKAEKRGYRVYSVIIENRHGNKNEHNCPDHAIERQRKNIIDSPSI